MSKINVNLIDPATPVPDTMEPDVAIPNTGGGNILGDSATTEIGLIILFVIVCVLLIFFYYRKKQLFNSFKISHIKTKIFSLFILTLIIGLIPLYANYQAKTEEPVNAANNALSITVDDVNINAVKSDLGTFAVASNEITVNTATTNGYLLNVYADTSDLIIEPSEDGGEDATPLAKISGLSSNIKTTLSENTWGIAINQSSIPTNDDSDPAWQSVPISSANAITLKNTDSATSVNDKTTVYYGVNINNSLPAGTYINTLVYTAIANTAPEPEPEPICGAYKICYNDNGANSPTTMSPQTIQNNATRVDLQASNFQYRDPNLPNSITIRGFAGWNTKADGTGTSYGPNETIADANIVAGIKASGLTLYAIWVEPTGNLQGWTGCSNMGVGQVTALKDTRDSNVYAVAKLKDNKCWMIENLRLDNQYTTGDTNKAKAQGYDSSFIGLADPETTNFSDSIVSNSLYSVDGSTLAPIITGSYPGDRFPRYNNKNTASPVTNITNRGDTTYSMGNYYTWTAAIADTSYHDSYNSNDQVINTSICPSNWRLPYGGTTGYGSESGGFSYLDKQLGGTGVNQSTAEASNRWAKYPNNFVYSAGINSDGITYTYNLGMYWSNTTDHRYAFEAHYFNMKASFSTESGVYFPSSVTYMGKSIRCLID